VTVGYKSGAIAYSAQSILTWAAKIVDIAPHYNDLTKDISARLEPNDAVYPFSHKYLGGLCPVAMSGIPLQYDENGIESQFRLSSILPSVAYYRSLTPTRNVLFIGEDRNDVL
jgi:hypothetical protein